MPIFICVLKPIIAEHFTGGTLHSFCPFATFPQTGVVITIFCIRDLKGGPLATHGPATPLHPSLLTPNAACSYIRAYRLPPISPTLVANGHYADRPYHSTRQLDEFRAIYNVIHIIYLNFCVSFFSFFSLRFRLFITHGFQHEQMTSTVPH